MLTLFLAGMGGVTAVAAATAAAAATAVTAMAGAVIAMAEAGGMTATGGSEHEAHARCNRVLGIQLTASQACGALGGWQEQGCL
jgi:hypothetical protein